MKPDPFRFLFLLVSLLALVPVEAAASAVCEQLRARLTRTTQTIGTSAEARKYANAIAQQNFRIRKVRNDLRQYGCSRNSVVAYGSEQATVCREIENVLTGLEAEKRDLVFKRDEARALGGTRDDNRRRILASLEYNGCNDPQSMPDSADLDPAARMEADREAAAMQNEAFMSGLDSEPFLPLDQAEPLVGGNMRGGSLRTVCVRSCDGGFFPISSNVTALDFARDANTCSRMCPGIGTELFYHSIYSTEAGDMVSAATGRPYRELENAFGYRDRKVGEPTECGCNLSAYYEEMQRREQGATSQDGKNRSSITEINTRPAAAKPHISAVQEQPERPYDPASQKVRQVGPQFLANDGGKIDLTNPALEGAQPQQ
ncbi:DUF2865 domain-containing protein [Rhizobiaceae bacterium n13]|uniref:DUF2865 domain-containing protein n=1 Tax=Ferirhizobium litorale TaxID=2927786 RepID=A0AAE3QJE1_9HYPH|nr:DUF2865 domain-containing protein [Fererhizobium litorale]MDI7863879.1 DUF2865 domain-containing protein [Fererhizobium litorale]MDI7924289.1 DUF2865 domain-containing protein [Fererhizobium litorale]